MTTEEAINIMKVIVHMLEEKYDTDQVEDAVDMAIRALKNEQTDGELQKEIDFWHNRCTEYEQIIVKIAIESNDVKAIPSAEKTDGDLISRTDLLKDIADLKKSPWFNSGKDIKDLFQHNSYVARKEAAEIIEDLCIKKFPSAENTAEWIFYMADKDGNDGKDEKWCKCSKCGYKEFYLPPKRNICPNCGAKMKGVEQ